MSAVGELAQIVSRRDKRGPREKHPDNKVGLAFMTPWLLGLLGITILPMIASLVLSFNLFGDGLRDALDYRIS